MSGALDEISVAIGGLQAEMKSVGRTLDNILDGLKGIQAHSAQTFSDHAKDIQSLNGFRNRVYGVTATLSVIMGIVGGYIGKKFS